MNSPSHKLRGPTSHPSWQPKHPKNISENFQQFLQRLYKVPGKHHPASALRSPKTYSAKTCKRVHGGLRDTSLADSAAHLSARLAPTSPYLPSPLKPLKMCRAKQLPGKMHQNENIHSREYNKTACQTRIFLFMQVNTEL